MGWGFRGRAGFALHAEAGGRGLHLDGPVGAFLPCCRVSPIRMGIYCHHLQRDGWKAAASGLADERVRVERRGGRGLPSGRLGWNGSDGGERADP